MGEAGKESDTDLEDKKIIELLYARDEAALAALSEKYGKLLRSLALNILGNREDAEECLNDTLLGTWNTIPPQSPNPLSSYICRITRNLACKKYHKGSAQKRNSHYDISLCELEECFASSEGDGSDSGEISAALDKFLLLLDKQSRVMFVRRYFFSEPLAEVADTLGVSRHYASVKLSRIREKLKKYLIQEGIYI